MGMTCTGVFCMSLVVAVIVAHASDAAIDPEIVSRQQWNARPAKRLDDIVRPVPYVVIHHTFVPAACNTTEECMQAMRWMQDFHQINRSWWDIGYNFAVGGDGKAYEGRGWTKIGAHAPRYNVLSMGIAIIGDWRGSLPPEVQLSVVHRLIAMGVREGHIAQDYRLVGHKQVRKSTDCPGEALYEEIKRWPHYEADPDRNGPKKQATPSQGDNSGQKGAAPFVNRLL